MTDLPTLTDGTVTLRPWRESDLAPAVAGHDGELLHWFGAPHGPDLDGMRTVVEGWSRDHEAGRRHSFVVAVGDDPVGGVEIRRVDQHTGEISYWLYAGRRSRGWATRAVTALIDWSLTAQRDGGLGLSRVEAKVEPANERSLRVATRSGLRREGLKRVTPGTGDRAETEEYVVLARLATDPPLTEPGAFRSLLNSFLPRKRAISQMLVRDDGTDSTHDGRPRVLLCRLTYKEDWDLPGGVVEVGESPQLAVSREVSEELALEIAAGRLLLTDWLPPWGGWDDALCLVFDGGAHPASILERVVPQAREIREAAFLGPDEIAERCAAFTARRIAAALANLDAAGPAYTESGRGSGW